MRRTAHGARSGSALALLALGFCGIRFPTCEPRLYFTTVIYSDVGAYLEWVWHRQVADGFSCLCRNSQRDKRMKQWTSP